MTSTSACPAESRFQNSAYQTISLVPPVVLSGDLMGLLIGS
jgi:hypothetical protein